MTLQATAEEMAGAAGLEPRGRPGAAGPAGAGHGRELGRARARAAALTGPVARGDDATVALQREAVWEAAPHLLPLFDALVERTEALAGQEAAGMRTVRTVAELRQALAADRRAGRSIGLVPTMGAFHDGHLSLMQRARADTDVVVVSLFVNPAQFGAGEDLGAYPRDEARDAELAAAEGVDILFAPARDEVYPPGFATAVRVERPHRGALRGPRAARPRALRRASPRSSPSCFNMVGPDVAYFGQKDAQQALVIRRLVRDLNVPVRIEVQPTVREPDGLAMSSRNAYLSPPERERALSLSRALEAADAVVAAGERDASAVLAAAQAELEAGGVAPEYLELRSADDLSPVERVNGSTLLAVAARVGAARLIDNKVLGGTK